MRKPVKDDVEKFYVLCIPYVGEASETFKRKITKLVQDMYKVNLSCVFQSFKVKQYFSLKCKTNPFLISNIVYKFSCQGDPDNFYVGETKRHIGVRAAEHLQTEGLRSAVGDHVKDCEDCNGCLRDGTLSYRNFEVLRRGNSKFDIEIQEALLIKKLNPSMNRQLFRSGSAATLRIFD